MLHRSAWVRLLLAVAALQVVGAVATAGFASGRVASLPAFDDLSGDPRFYLVPLLTIVAGGTLLLVLGRDDPRAVDLGAFFVLLSCPFTSRWLLGLAHIAPPAVAWLAVALRSLQVDSFFPWFFWRFAGRFPEGSDSPRLRRVLAAGLRVSFALGAVLFLRQIGLLVRNLVVTGAALPDAAPAKPSWGHYGALSLATLAALAVLFWRARTASGEERRRASLFAGALAFGVAPLFLLIVLGMISSAQREIQESPEVQPAFVLIALGCFLTIPFTTGYAVLVHHALNVKLIARRALQYTLARYSAMALAAVPMLALAAYLYYRREERLGDLFSGVRLLLLLTASAAGVLALRYRKVVLEGIDRRFFREQYDARQILTLLVERIRAVGDVASLAGLIAREIDMALHLEGIGLMVLDPRSGMLNDPRRRVQRLDASSHLARLVSDASDPLSTDLEDPRSPVGKLPDNERHWLVDSGFKLIVPMVARDGALLGLIGLGGKKSGLPFLGEDRQLLHAVASAAAWVLELAQVQSGSGGARRVSSRDYDLEDTASAVSEAELAKECPNPHCGALHLPYTVLCSHCSRRLEPSHVPYVLPGRFRFEKRIGAGGMGVVYRGADLALGRPVAVKTLRRVSPEDAMRLRREARTAAAVSHPHLAPVYGMETWQGTPMLIMELLEGGTLTQRIEKGERDPLETVELGIAMADALAQLHAADILHRDIKPSNIGYTRDGVPKLMDFGIARAIFDLRRDSLFGALEDGEDESLLPSTSIWNESPSSITISKQLVGTLSYLSPEALNGAPADASFDLWGLAVVLYECLLGRKVFAGDAKQIMARIRLGRVPEFSQVLPELDEPLGDFFRAALHKTPSRRPVTALDFKRRLEAVRMRLTSPPDPVSHLPSDPRRERGDEA